MEPQAPPPDPGMATAPAVRWPRYVTAGLCVAIFATCLWLYTRENTFPYAYHPDEPGKAGQIRKGRRNYRHPQLLLECSQIAVAVAGIPLGEKDAADAEVRRIEQAVTVAGRWVSAAFAAGAVVALALAGYRAGGLAGLAMAGASVGLCAPLLLSAHYMKEDTALVFGVALVVLASAAAWESRHLDESRRRRAAALLGAACAVAVCGKYIGILALAAALPLLPVWRGTPGGVPAAQRKRLLKAFFVTLAVVALVINWRGVKNPGTWLRAIGNQVKFHAVESEGLTMYKPTSFYARATLEEVPVDVLVLAAVGIAFLGLTWRRRSRWDVMLVAAPLAYLAVLSFANTPVYRYVLPTVVLLHFLAAVAVVWLLQWLGWGGTLRTTVAVAFVSLVVWLQLPQCLAMTRQFGNDSRGRLLQWVAANLPPEAVVLQDKSAGLEPGNLPGPPPSPGGSSPRLISIHGAPEMGGFDVVYAHGVTHVVTSSQAYGRYFNPYVIPTADFRDEYDRRRAWYEQLDREGQLLWWSDPSPPGYAPMNPTIRVYRLPVRRDALPTTLAHDRP